MDQVERIKLKLRLAKNTDTFLEVFGASSHEYRLDAPIALEEVEIWEKEHNISLPQDYKTFITQVGNGGYEYESQVKNSGAGPNYGIYKFGQEINFIADTASGYLQNEPYFDTTTTEESWKEIYENIPDDISYEDYDKLFEKAYSGILTISASGCAGFNGIMLKGENAGRVVAIFNEIEYCPKLENERNFLDWYENWLNNIIEGKSFKSRTPYETVENLFKRLNKAENTHWKLVALGYIRGFDVLEEDYIKELWHYYQKEEDNTVKLYTLNLLAKFDYENSKAELERLYTLNPIESLKILHLYQPLKISEWETKIADLQKNSTDTEVTEYIGYVIQKTLLR